MYIKAKIPLQLVSALLLLIFSGCDKDSNTPENLTKNKSVHTISFEELKSRIKSAPGILQRLENRQSGTISSKTQSGFEFELDSIKEFQENANYQSYTIKAKKINADETEYIYKLLIENRNNTITSSLITFDYRNKLLVPINKEAFILDSATSRMECYAVTFIVECSCHQHSAPCDHPSSYTYHYCSGSNGGGETTSITNINGGVTTVGTSGANPSVAILSEEEALELYGSFTTSLTSSQKALMETNSLLRVEIFSFFITEGFGGSKRSFAKQAINYIIQHPTITFNQYKNWFLGSGDGTDGDFDALFWENPSLTFPQQSLPTMTNFKNAYPKNLNGTFEMSFSDVYNLIGGIPKAMRDEVLTDDNPLNDHNYNNACALRTSRALNYSGVTIPNIPGKTFKGEDNKYYFLGARNLYNWMIKTFPTNSNNSIVLNQSQGGTNGINFPSLLGNFQGIYILIPVNQSVTGFGASGHAGIFTTPELTHYYFAATGGVKSITLWILN
ncbi:T6SS effector amidase Tae4 family protein [Flavobacterium sp.]|uniref:T6SS effector amidase Tae4 family protein n=1 Tax=Flavobacterium sp. TaxID=239 RepID=UPI003D6B08FB